MGGPGIFGDNSRFGEFNSRLADLNSRLAALRELPRKGLLRLTIFSDKWRLTGEYHKIPGITGKNRESCPRLLQPRAVAVDVVRAACETRAIAADDRFEGFVEAAVVGICGGEPLARRLDAATPLFS